MNFFSGMSMRHLMLIGCAILAAPATAQDFGGLNPADVGQGMVMPSAVAAQARMDARGGRRSGTRGSTPAQRQACANLDRFRAENGASNAKVRQLTQLCQRAGLIR